MQTREVTWGEALVVELFRTDASRGFAATGDLLAVQTALGHASVATTQRYVAVSSASVRAVSEAAAA